MPSFCAVVSCNDRYGHSENVSFHKFPLKRSDLLTQWEAFIQRQRGPNWRASRWSSLCSRHFREEDFKSLNERKTLKKSAVPSIIGDDKAKNKKASDNTREEDVSNKEFTEILAIKERLEDVSNVTKTNCRLCGVGCVPAVTFATNYELYGMLQKCFPTLNIQQDDSLPKALCSSCNRDLQQFREFVDRVWTAQTELQRKYKSRNAEKPLKIKQEPFVRVKQEVAEYGYDQNQLEVFGAGNEDYDVMADGVHEEGEDSGTVDHKYEFCDFPIINDCDIMEIINLDDPYINIPDDDNNEGQELERSDHERINYLPSAHELLQEHLLMEEHNYAYVDTEDFKEERRVYKTEKTENEERPSEMTAVTAETEKRMITTDEFCKPYCVEPQNTQEERATYEKRALKPIVTSVSAIQQPSKPNSIIVLNESIVKSGGGFQLHECMVCQLKFFSIESLKEHYTQTHGTPMVSVPVANIAPEKCTANTCKMEKEIPDNPNPPENTREDYMIEETCQISSEPVDSAAESTCKTEKEITDTPQAPVSTSEVDIDNQICQANSGPGEYVIDSTYSGTSEVKHSDPNQHRENNFAMKGQQIYRIRSAKRRDRHLSLNTMASQYQQLKKLYQKLQRKCLNLEQNVEQLQLHPPAVITKQTRKRKPRISSATECKYISQYTCPVCSKSFANSNSFRQHKITHTEEKNHSCSLCQRSFKRRNGLLQHLKGFHMQVKPFVCPVCKYSFALKCDMLRCKHSALKWSKYTE